MKTSDMSKAQFRDACARYGFTTHGFLDYYDLGIEGHRVSVSVLNAGDNRRARLAYLLRERARVKKQYGIA